jgi:hypothetical protein
MLSRMVAKLRFASIAVSIGMLALVSAAMGAGSQIVGNGSGDGTMAELPEVLPDSIPPTALLLSPNSYQVWAMGTLQKISWRATDNNGVASIDLDFSADSGATWTPIATAIPNSGLYYWKVPNVRTARALIQVTSRDSVGNAASDRSNATFEIKDRLAPTMAVTTPNGGQVWLTGTVHKLTWKATDNVAVVRIDLSYSVNGGATWTGIASRLANSGSYQWTLPLNVVTSNALVKAAAADSAGNSTSDVSNAPFEIRDGTPPVMTVTTPNGGQIWDVGLAKTVTWKATDNVRVKFVDLDWSPDSGATWLPVARDLENTGKYVWTIPPAPTTNALFRATARDSMDNAGSDLGNAPFVVRDLVAPAVTLISPNGGETWTAGTPRTIAWTASDNAGVRSIDLAYSPDSGATWSAIASGLPNSGAFGWTVPLAPSSRYRVRIVARDLAGNIASDASDALFTVRSSGELRKIMELRADAANGTGPYPAPGNAGPWIDRVGGHDAALVGFHGTLASGWVGDGAPGNPRRLEFAGEEPGWNNHVAIPAGSVPELQSLGASTSAVWFKTGFDGPSSRYEYVLEWVQRPAEPFDPEFEGRGMSIVLQDGTIQVYANPWITLCPAAPNTWYHVAVVKDTNDLRVYVNGRRLHAGTKSHRGTQESEIALGASIFRRFEGRDGDAAFSDFFRGAVGQFDLWQGTFGDAEALAAFRADSATYLGTAPVPADSAVVRLDAARPDGLAPPAVPGAAGPWVDLAAPAGNFRLFGFDATANSGWVGDGAPATPYRLELDGVNDVVAIDAAGVPELRAATAITAEVRFRTGADVSHAQYRYVIEWLHCFGASPGLSVAIAEGRLRLYAGAFVWTDLGAVTRDTWYRLDVVKAPGSVRVFVNGTLVHAGIEPNFGVPNSGIVLGASTWRGAAQYGEHLACAIASATMWARALSDAEIAGPPALRSAPSFEGGSIVATHALSLAGARPNPARGPLHVHFALPDGAPAALELLDVSGRRVTARDVGTLGAGRHAIHLGEGEAIRPGVYWLRLTHAGRSLTSKAVVID